jgi:hypothetical protein
MEFVFVLTKYNEVTFTQQVSKVLENRTELISRKEHPQMWKYIDIINSRIKVSEEVLKKRRRRNKIYGILLLLLGFFILIPSLMKPEEMLVPLLVSVFAIVIGILKFRYGSKLKKEKLTSFDKAAIQLFNGYNEIPSGKVTVAFTNDKVQLGGNDSIDYSKIEKIFITEDLFILIWNDRVTVLQKKDLSSHNVEEFINFIKLKSHNLFEVVNII